MIENIKKRGRKRRSIMCRASELAKIVINRCLDLQYPISAPKVQKLLVLMHGEFLARYNEPLFKENVQVWECGVAIAEVNADFRKYTTRIDEPQDTFLVLLKREDALMEEIINKFGGKSLFEINQDSRLVRVKDTYIDQQPVSVPNDFIRKVFLEYGSSN